MLYKLTKKLFHGAYKYKIVLVCPGASVFRSNDFDEIAEDLTKLAKTIDENKDKLFLRKYLIKDADELKYAWGLYNVLSKLNDFDKRIESPWISVYSNSKDDIDKIANVNTHNVKYICAPPDNELEENTIILPKIDFDYRITLGKTTQTHDAFVQWAEATSKLKLTKSCRKELLKPRSWGGSYFYLSGDNNLLLAKMHLGSCISKIERIIKA